MQCKLNLGVASVRLWQNRLSNPELEKQEPVSARAEGSMNLTCTYAPVCRVTLGKAQWVGPKWLCFSQGKGFTDLGFSGSYFSLGLLTSSNDFINPKHF